NLLTAGGNYGWNRREGLHPFGPRGTGPRKDLIDPIWEYHHDVGKSITGGGVYRGDRVKELQGAYVYADYVSGKMWALRYDPDKPVRHAQEKLRPLDLHDQDVLPRLQLDGDALLAGVEAGPGAALGMDLHAVEPGGRDADARVEEDPARRLLLKDRHRLDRPL